MLPTKGRKRGSTALFVLARQDEGQRIASDGAKPHQRDDAGGIGLLLAAFDLYAAGMGAGVIDEKPCRSGVKAVLGGNGVFKAFHEDSAFLVWLEVVWMTLPSLMHGRQWKETALLSFIAS